MWDMTLNTLITTGTGHISDVNAVAILKNGDVVSVSDDRTVKLWQKTI
jgi:hypothetical protein